MSTTNPTTTTAGAGQTTSPTPTSAPSDSNTATLYLFTFLATILILILLSASLVLRSYILRRRYRRHFQQALTDTVFVDFDRSAIGGQFDPLGIRRHTRRLGPKPVLWDIWIHPADDDAWSSFTPVAVRCTTSSPPTSISSQPSAAPPATPSPPQSHPSFFSRFRLANPLSPSPRDLPRRQADSSIAGPALVQSPPVSAPGCPSPCPHTEKEEAEKLAVCVLVAMPDVSAPVHRPVPDAKGKGVDPLESQALQSGGDADPLLPSSPSPRQSGVRFSDMALEEERLPLLEFGVVELATDVWR